MAAIFTPKLCSIFFNPPLETETRKKRGKKKVKVLAGFWRLKVAGIGARGGGNFWDPTSEGGRLWWRQRERRKSRKAKPWVELGNLLILSSSI